jgi:hypothetical protein
MNWNLALTKLSNDLKEEKNTNTDISSKDNASIRSSDVNSVHNRFNQK